MNTTDKSRLTKAAKNLQDWFEKRNNSTYCYDKWMRAMGKFKALEKELKIKYTGKQGELI